MKNFIRSLALVLALAVVAPARAQTVQINPTSTGVVVGTRHFAVPVVLDLSNADTLTVASFAGSISWSGFRATVQLDSVTVDGQAFALWQNNYIGGVDWSAFRANAFPAGTIATLYFTATPPWYTGMMTTTYDIGAISLNFSVVGTENGQDITASVTSTPVAVYIWPCQIYCS